MKKDTKLLTLIQAEEKRQSETLDLIASENFASREVREMLGSVLTNKYSEGYPRKRYYPGNVYVDAIEELAILRAKKAFRLGDGWRVNVQPYSGSPANIAVYFALMNFGDTLMGMELSAGGHLTHGHKVNFSGRAYTSVSYGVNPKTGLIDYNEIERLAKKVKPKVIVSGLTAYPRTIDFKKFGAIAKKVGACHVADISHIAGLVAAGLHSSPLPYADIVTTTTHKTLRGPRGAVIFSKSKIKNQKSKISIAEAIDRAIFPGLQGGPHNNVTAAIAYMFGEIASNEFKTYAKRVVENAAALAAAFAKGGARLVTGGTDNHLMLLDVRPFGLDGLEAEKLLESAGIIANRNSIPGDVKPLRPSGIRIGTPAVTTRGLLPKHMPHIAEWILDILQKRKNSSLVKEKISRFLKDFPVP